MASAAKLTAIIKADDKASPVLKGLQGNLHATGAQMRQVGMAAIVASGAILAAFGLAVKAAIDFEEAMADVKKTTGLASDALAELSEGIKDLSTEIPLTTNALAKIAAVAGQLGIQGKESILSFVKTSAMMSTAFDMAAEDAATAMAKMANIYDIPINEVDRLASAINRLGNTTAARESEIITAMTKVGGAGKALGMASTDVAALTTQLIAMGQAPERAGTRLMAAFNQMASSMDITAGVMGISVDELKTKFERDFMGTLLGLLSQLETSYPNTFDRMAKANEIFGTTGSKAMMAIGQDTEGFLSILDRANIAFKENIDLQTEFDARVETTAAQMTLLKNRMMGVAITVGDSLLPVLEDMMSLVEVVISVLSDWIKANPELVRTLVPLIAQGTGLVFVLTSIAMVLPKVTAGIHLLTAAILKTPLGWLLLGIGMVIGGLYLLNEHYGWVDLSMNKTTDSMVTQGKVTDELISKMKDHDAALWAAGEGYDNLGNKAYDAQGALLGVTDAIAANETAAERFNRVAAQIIASAEKSQYREYVRGQLKGVHPQLFPDRGGTTAGGGYSSPGAAITGAAPSTLNRETLELQRLRDLLDSGEDIGEAARQRVREWEELEKQREEYDGYRGGGLIPGHPGQAVPIMAHAGERVLTAGQARGSGGGDIIVNVYPQGSIMTEGDITEAVRTGLINIRESNYTSGV